MAAATAIISGFGALMAGAIGAKVAEGIADSKQSAMDRIKGAQNEQDVQIAKARIDVDVKAKEEAEKRAKTEQDLYKKRAMANKAQGRDSTLLTDGQATSAPQGKTLLGQ